MSDLRTIDSAIANLPSPEGFPELPKPAYDSIAPRLTPLYVGTENHPGTSDRPKRCSIGLAVESMKRHMTDEGWIIFSGLEAAGWKLAGYDIRTEGNCPGVWCDSMTDVQLILDFTNADTVLLQDKREWEGLTADRNRDPRMRFKNVKVLASRPDVFRGTVLKDAQNSPAYHRQSAEEIGCHFWVVYYHPRIVRHVAPWVRQEHLIRTYHSVDASRCISSPDKLAKKQDRCMLSGAISDAYPLRKRLAANISSIPGGYVKKHPGYHRRGCCTPEFLAEMNTVKVSICTSSVYGYALRKIIESVACGAVPITDLPTDEVLPEIDGALIRVHPDIGINALNHIVEIVYASYSPESRGAWAEKAKRWYDWRAVGKRLSDDIERLRSTYGNS